MKLFQCQHCRARLYFENTRCESCGRNLGYLPSIETLTALEPSDGVAWQAHAEPNGRYRYCANAEHGVCNWLVPADQPDSSASACRHNRTIPDLSLPENLRTGARSKVAKHRLFYTLLKLRLPLATKAEDPDGLAFDFIADQTGARSHIPVMTGHEDGLITINLAEADDAERERRRSQMGEPYRTLLGHFRHEIAHYYWDRLVAQSAEPGGVPRRSSATSSRITALALQQHYADGPPPDWPERFVTAYASSHPWEDFAETWAHYLHMVDTLETASAFGLSVRPKLRERRHVRGEHRLRPAPRRDGPAHRGLAAAHLRDELDQPQHGPAGPLSLRAAARGDREARTSSTLAFILRRVGAAPAPGSGLKAIVAGSGRSTQPQASSTSTTLGSQSSKSSTALMLYEHGPLRRELLRQIAGGVEFA